MGNKAIILVAGLFVIFLSIGARLFRITSSAYLKYVEYISYQQATLAAESAANIAISNARITPNAPLNVSNARIYSDPDNKKEEIDCFISMDKQIFPDSFFITAVSDYNDFRCTTKVKMSRPSFANYAMYTEIMKLDDGKTPIYWITGDTCRGPLHTQDYLYVSGRPVFIGKVTTKMGVIKENTTDAPVFMNGCYTGVDNDLPEDLSEVKSVGEAGGAVYNGVATYIQFLADGRIVVRLGSNGWNENRVDKTEPITGKPYCKYYKDVAELTKSGVVLVKNAEVHVKGVLNGRITIGALGTGSKVWIDSSLVYQTSPIKEDGSKNSDCDDMLGIVADNGIRISEGAENNGSKPKGVTIHAALFSKNDGFGAYNYDTRPVGGTLKVVGGIHTKKRVPVGTFVGGTTTHGFQKDYWFDERMKENPPIAYPRFNYYTITNWYDQTEFPDEFWAWF